MAGHQQKRFNRTQKSIANVGLILGKQQPWADGGNAGRLMMFNQLPKWIDTNYLSAFKTNNTKYYEVNGSVKAQYPFLDGDGFDVYKILHREARDRTAESDKYDVCMKQSGKTKTDMLAICTSTIMGVNTKGWLSAWKAGVISIGAVDGVNIYSSEGGLSENLEITVTAIPSPTIEGFSGE
jgi:hypothetical protein